MVKFILKAVFLTIGYAIGLPLTIAGIAGGSILMLVVGLVFCGLPFGIAFYARGKKNEDNEAVAVYNVNSDGSYYRVGGWKKFALALLGLVCGLVATPVYIIYCIVKAVKLRPRKDYVAGSNSKGPQDKPLIKCSEAMYNAYCKKLGDVVPELKKNAPVLIMASMVTKSAMDTFFNEYPQNMNEVKTKIPNTSDAFYVAVMERNARKQFLANYPNNVQAVKKNYPNVSEGSIITVITANMSDKEKEKMLKKYAKLG